MKGLQVGHNGDLHAGSEEEANVLLMDAMGDDDHDQVHHLLSIDQENPNTGNIWLDAHDQGANTSNPENDDLLCVNDTVSLFYGDLPPLPDFPCMSSSSSSSATQLPVNTIVPISSPVNAMASSSSSSSASSSSNSATSWAILRSDGDDLPNQQDPVDNPTVRGSTLQSTASMEIHHQGMDGVDCMDIMETFGYMDLLDSNDLFDPSSIFPNDQTPPIDTNRPQDDQSQELHQQHQLMLKNTNEDRILCVGESQGHESSPPLDQRDGDGGDDLAAVFLEWLKSNKETVSAEDLRKVKIKKATIESAARRLGGGKEAMKQLLKLILEWVQTNHLQKRRNSNDTIFNNYPQQHYQESAFQNPNPNNNTILISPDPTTPQWNINFPPPHHPTAYDPGTLVSGFGQSVMGYMAAGATYQDYHHMMEPVQHWGQPPPPQPHQFAMAGNPQYGSFADGNTLHPGMGFTGYPYPYNPYHFPGQIGDQRMARLGSSATKEARKKRMARQRRFLSHHHRNHQHNQNSGVNQQCQQARGDQHARSTNGGGESYATPQLNPGNWIYWSNVGTATGGPAPGPPPPPPVIQSGESNLPVEWTASALQPAIGSYQQRPIGSERKQQGLKPEKNLRFLLQKVLKQSDVGNLGRIVLPKKEAETHLPELEARDGISIAMEDIGTSRVWNMRYRFWPNNKSRMYLLENTGDFVKSNGLQEGDFIVIYSDVKCGKYLIRGVKVRQPAGAKAETRRQSKSQRTSHSNNNGLQISCSPSSSPIS